MADVLSASSSNLLLVAIVASSLGLVLAYAWVFPLGAPGLRPTLAGWSVLYPDRQLTPAVDLAQLVSRGARGRRAVRRTQHRPRRGAPPRRIQWRRCAGKRRCAADWRCFCHTRDPWRSRKSILSKRSTRRSRRCAPSWGGSFRAGPRSRRSSPHWANWSTISPTTLR